MSLSRRAKRRDANEGVIVRALESAGAVVHPIDQPGDLLVGYAGRWHVLEVKDGSKSPSRRRLTAYQESFHRLCGEFGLVIPVVTTIAEAFSAVGIRIMGEGVG